MNKIAVCGLLLCMVQLSIPMGGCTDNEGNEDNDASSDSDTVTGSETETETETTVDTETETETETAVDTETETETETAVDTETETETETVADTETETDTATAVDTETETETETVADTETETDTATAVDTETETETTTTVDTETETDTETAVDTETETDTETAVDTETETETETIADTETDTEAPGVYCYYEDLEQTQINCVDHGETCDDPELLLDEGTYVFSNAPFQGNYAWNSAPIECIPSDKFGQDLVYAIDLPSMKKLSARVDGIALEGINFYPKLFVSTSCDELVQSCVAGQSASFEDVRAEYTNSSEQPLRLYLVVDSDFGDSGLFSLDVKFVEPEIASEIGESCSKATALVLPASGSSDTVAFTHELLNETPSGENVCESTGRDGFFAFTVDVPSTVKLDTLTSISSKHGVFLYEDGCDAENEADFTYTQLGGEATQTSCGVSKFSSALMGYYTQIEIDAVPGVNYVYGVQLFAETTATSEFELTVSVD